MAQAKLINCTETKEGIKLIFRDLGGHDFSGIYNLGNLNIDQLKKLIGTQISFSETEKGINVHRAWDGNKPVFSEETYAGDDRADR